jgi:hypothetical protein
LQRPMWKTRLRKRRQFQLAAWICSSKLPCTADAAIQEDLRRVTSSGPSPSVGLCRKGTFAPAYVEKALSGLCRKGGFRPPCRKGGFVPAYVEKAVSGLCRKGRAASCFLFLQKMRFRFPAYITA